MAEVSIDELREAVEHLHGCPARFTTKHYVEERFRGELAWRGEVHEFALDGHPKATVAYAWSHFVDDESDRRQFVAVLGGGKIDSPSAAVRAAIVAEHRR